MSHTTNVDSPKLSESDKTVHQFETYAYTGERIQYKKGCLLFPIAVWLYWVKIIAVLCGGSVVTHFMIVISVG